MEKIHTLKVTGTWKDDKLRITHTLTIDAKNIEEATEILKGKYPQWQLVSIRSKTT